MEKKPKGGSRSIGNANDARAYIAAGAHPDERLRRKQRCIENGWIPNDFSNPFFNHFGFNDNGIHVANRAMYLELYEKELQIAYNNGRASVISELSEG